MSAALGGVWRAALLGWVTLGACSGGSAASAGMNANGAAGTSSSDAAALPDGEVSCQSDPRLSPDALPLAQSGKNGYGVTLVTRSPNPSAKGLNEWTIAVSDASGAPLSGAALRLSTTMPDHGHQSPAPSAPASDAQGNVTVPGLNFFMAGVWRVQIDVFPATAAPDADASDSVVFFFCVEG